MDAAIVIVVIVLVAGAGLAAFMTVQLYRILRLPRNNPKAYLRRAETRHETTPVLVTIGDSITHGHVSGDYVAMLRDGLDQRNIHVEVVNAGINSELAWNVNQRLDEIIECNPAFITILIGTNDANVILREVTLKIAMRQQQLPRVPELPWYQENLANMIDRLRASTTARIAVVSIPTIGEDPGDAAFTQATTYAIAAREVARKHGADYIPLHETMVDMLREQPAIPRHDHAAQVRLMVSTIIANCFGLSWDRIGRGNGFRLHTDFLHLNDVGAAIVARMIEEWMVRSGEATAL